MKKLFCIVFLALAASAAGAQVIGDPSSEGEFGGVSLNPVRSGKFELTPILSTRYNNGRVAVNVGASFGYLFTPSHQIGGTLVFGNTLRESQAIRVRNSAVRSQIEEAVSPTTGQVLSNVSAPLGIGLPSELGWGASMTGFYRYNIPYERRKVSPFLSVFGGRDFHNGYNYSELGGSIGARKAVSRRATLTMQYGYSFLFLDGGHEPRNIVSIGVSTFFGG